MKFYKIAQEQPFLFPKEELPDELQIDFSGNYREDLEYAENFKQIEIVLNHYDLNWQIIEFPEADPVIVVYDNNETIIIDDFEYPTPKNAEEWIYEIWDFDLSNYVSLPDYNQSFWEQVGPGYSVYHGTTQDNLHDIINYGLEPRSDSRGISNRGTGEAVFASENPDSANRYPVVLQIDVGAMKKDGYMPTVSQEEPIDVSAMRNALAHKIDLENFQDTPDSSDGLAEDTVIFYGPIPPKYISVYE